MSKHPIPMAMAVAVLLTGLPALGSAAELPMVHSCVKALISQLTLQSKTPVKLLRTVSDDSSGPPPSSQPRELTVTARDAHTDRLIAQMVCAVDRHGQISLQPLQ